LSYNQIRNLQIIMAAKSGKKKKTTENIKLVNPNTGYTYYKKKSKKLDKKLALMKYDPISRKHEEFLEKKF